MIRIRTIARAALEPFAGSVGTLRRIPLVLWVTASAGWVALLIAEFLQPDSVVQFIRPVAVFLFALFTPGWAVTGCLPLQSLVERLVAAVAFSFSSVLIVSVGFTIAHNGSMNLRLATLAALTTMASVIAMILAVRDTPSSDARAVTRAGTSTEVI
ncbi:hypothetical protein [Rhodococcus sp. BUPNP1]|nr:hypothetical protein [Rhodococcus sp. BUPNP1]